ncbi:hypothetical protein [Vibrio phage vB_VibM_83AMN]|nr:hypothetical protein [Vibrio phage vB_VibM_83AMN]
MNVYMAAVYTNGYMKDQRRYEKLNESERKSVMSVPHLLESFHYINKQAIIDVMRSHGAKVFLDSGAFSAWNAGVVIDIDAYCDYIKANHDLWLVDDTGALMCSVLDGIGDPLKTYQNQKYMERQGVRPLPCFHFGEDIRYLEEYVNNYTYITIGGMVGKSAKQLINWLDGIWDKGLLDGSGNLRTKVHAFGITSQDIMKRYPWSSCDSSSWIQAAAFGNIITRDWGILCISDKSARKHVANAHINTFSPPETQAVARYVESHGFNLERLASVYESRATFNLTTFNDINVWINEHESGINDGIKLELF